MPTSKELRPPSVIHHVRRRLEAMATEDNCDRRPWYLRWFITRVVTHPPHAAEVIQLSDCDVKSRTCAGKVVGRWLVSESIVVAYERDGFAVLDTNQPSAQEMVVLPVFIFCLEDGNNAAVVWELDDSGNRTKNAFALPQGLASETFGEQIGETTRDLITKESAWHPLTRYAAEVRGANSRDIIGT